MLVKFKNADVPKFNMIDDSSLDAIGPGEPMYDGFRVRNPVASRADDSFAVETANADSPDGVDQKELSDGEFGESYLMWCRSEYGSSVLCPSCGGPRDAVAEFREGNIGAHTPGSGGATASGKHLEMLARVVVSKPGAGRRA